MKRTYIKPFMESEEFVTNEYVAACYLVTCVTAKENFITHTKPEPDSYDAFTPDGYTWALYDGYAPELGGCVYYDNRGNEFSHEGHSDEKWDAHKVTIETVKTAGTLSSGTKYGPNAS